MAEIELNRAIADLPDRIKPTWDAALEACRKQRLPVMWRGLGAPPSIEAVREIRGVVDLVCVTRDEFEKLAEATSSSPELAKLDGIEYAAAFEAAKAHAIEPIVKGTSTETVWSERFKSLFETAGRVTVNDRYLLKNHRRAFGESGFDHLYEWVTRDAPQCDLRILSALVRPDSSERRSEIGNEWEAKEAEAYWEAIEGTRRRVAPFGPKRLEVYLTKNWVHASAKSRIVRFDDRCVVEMDPGFEVLQGDAVRRVGTFSLKCLASGGMHRRVLKEGEDRLQQRSGYHDKREWVAART